MPGIDTVVNIGKGLLSPALLPGLVGSISSGSSTGTGIGIVTGTTVAPSQLSTAVQTLERRISALPTAHEDYLAFCSTMRELLAHLVVRCTPPGDQTYAKHAFLMAVSKHGTDESPCHCVFCVV